MTHSADREFDSFLDKGLTTLFGRLRPDDEAADPSCADTKGEPEEAAVPDRLASYRVTGRLGSGGVGIVYRIEDPVLGRELAIKVLARRYAADQDLRSRFVQEAKVCSRLQHPGVVPIHEMGELGDGRPYFTMKIVEGDDLQHLLQSRRHPADRRRQFLETFEKLCQTVAFAHSRGVVHCDLKPGNVMVGAFGEVQLMDWGFARETSRSDGPAESDAGGLVPQRVAGTPAYMAPEQARGELLEPDPRVDVFGLGAILCEILTGAAPYLGEDRIEVLLRAAKGWLEDARERLQACGGDEILVRLSERCMSPDPADRPRDASFVARQITEYLALAEQRAHELEVEAARAHARASSERRVTRLTIGWSSTLFVVLILAIAAYLWVDSERRGNQERLERAVRSAMDRALALESHARAVANAEPGQWTEALEAARQSAELARALAGDCPLRASAEELAVAVTHEHEAALRDVEMLAVLEEARHDRFLGAGGADPSDVYAEAFSAWGAKPDLEPIALVAGRIAASGIRGELSTALHDWAAIRKQTTRQRQSWTRLLDVADAADADPVRTRLRHAFRTDDLDELHAVAGSVDPATCDPETIDLLASSLRASGDLDGAIALLRKAFLHWPDNACLSHNLAVYLGELGDDRPREEIVRVLSACVAVRPRSAHALTDLGLALTYVGDHDQARLALRRACEISPGYARAWTNAGFNELEAGRFAEAEFCYRRGIEAAPMAVAAHMGLGRVLERVSRHEDAVREYERILELAPDDADALIRLGLTRRRLGDRNGAESAFRRAIENEPDNATARCNLGLVLKALGRYSEAVVQLRIGHELGVSRPGWVHPSAGWVEEAERLVRVAERLERIANGEVEPDDAVECIDAAKHAHRHGRYDAALELWRRVSTESPDAMIRTGYSQYYDAACAALLVAAGRATDRDPAASTARRRLALDWLRLDLENKRERFGAPDFEGDPVRILSFWHHDPDLRSVRGDAALAALPPDEAEAWRDLWREHADLLRAMHTAAGR